MPESAIEAGLVDLVLHVEERSADGESP